MKHTIHHAEHRWNWKSETLSKTDDKDKLSYRNTLNLFIKLLIRAVILAIVVTAITWFVFEIVELF